MVSFRKDCFRFLTMQNYFQFITTFTPACITLSLFFIFTTFVYFLLVFLNMVAALGFGDTPLSAFHPILGAPQFLFKDSLKLSLIPCSSPFTSSYWVILLAHLILCTISCKLMFWGFFCCSLLHNCHLKSISRSQNPLISINLDQFVSIYLFFVILPSVKAGRVKTDLLILFFKLHSTSS